MTQMTPPPLRPESSIDPSIPIDQRPLCGHDVETLRSRFGLDRISMAAAMGVTTNRYAELASKSTALDVDQEILLRLYLNNPGPAPWTQWTPRQAFERFYGDLLASFEDDSDKQEAARMMLYRRLTALFGRSYSRAYMWIENNDGYGTVMKIILAKIQCEKDPEFTLLAAAETTMRNRGGGSIQTQFPLPDNKTIQTSGPGRPRKKRTPRILGN